MLKELLNGKKTQAELSLDQGELASALGILKRNKLISMEKTEKGLSFSAEKGAKEWLSKQNNPLEHFKESKALKELNKEEQEAYEALKMRKGLLKLSKEKSISAKLTKEGEKLAEELKSSKELMNLLEALTPEMLRDGSWKGKEFRHYDVKVPVPFQELGRQHPTIEANNILKDVFVEMGFQEMEGPMVELAFWNMDSMWIPQDHPARDEQDTFYLEGSGKVNKDLMKKVKKMHEEGVKRSHTPKGEWSEEIAQRRLLRTHSTATTFRTLAKLGEDLKKGKDVNGKYFYIANNFRNEAVDATHLAEFYQAEGFIIGDDLSLADLMGFIKEYYSKLGIDTIKFKPTYNPYTEPSMEAHYYDEKMGKWYALINSGMFRRETLEPLGLGKKTIIAWGMGASRVATLLAGVHSMREITGATCDFEWLRTRPLMMRKIVR
jgi:phenylalanyl-tRNA synthetase alpha chain